MTTGPPSVKPKLFCRKSAFLAPMAFCAHELAFNTSLNMYSYTLPLNFVGAALGDERHVAAGDAAEFRGDPRGDDLKLRHGVHRRNLIGQPVRLAGIHHAAIDVIIHCTGSAAIELHGVAAYPGRFQPAATRRKGCG